MAKSSTHRPRKPSGRWIFYLLYEGILWPCPVHWEWERSFDGWLPFYFSPTLEFVAADPSKVVKVSLAKSKASHSVAGIRTFRLDRKKGK